jgi:hypothetical protein
MVNAVIPASEIIAALQSSSCSRLACGVSLVRLVAASVIIMDSLQ